ncbi:M24 family metallopeptidase [bacterium]|nr:MAG: M24 family metallopeptidase [bacterium]
MLAAILALQATQQQSDYPVYDTDLLPPAEYTARREKLLAAMPKGSVGVLFTNAVHVRNNDVDFDFRADSDFLYTTGFTEPNAAVLLSPDGITVDGKTAKAWLFLDPPSGMSVTWLGYRMGPEGAKRVLGIDALPNRRFPEIVKALGAKPILGGTLPPGANDSLVTMANALPAGVKRPPLSPMIAEMRWIKSPAEIAMLRKAVNASIEGHRLAQAAAKPGLHEYDLEAIAEMGFKRNGCEDMGYPSILGAGENSCILHYNTNRRLLKAGDVVCMDAGGEYHGYTADVTRTFPVSGKFSPEQKAIYDLVLAAQNAGIGECVSGKPFNAPGQAATRVIAEGLKKLGIIQKDAEVRKYFMHGTSHSLGLDVHDVMPLDSTLKPGVVLTVEPGIYIRAGSPVDKKWWNIGCRIEDDILVTKGAPDNLSGALSR